MAQIDIDTYNQTKEKIFDNRIDIIVDYFLNHPLEIEKFTNTILSFDNILIAIVTKLAQPKEKGPSKIPYTYQNAFSKFLMRGEIYKVFDALIQFIAVQDTPLNQLIELSFIDKLFSQSTPCMSQQPSEFYNNIYTFLNKNNACYALQKLWLFMDRHTDHKNYFDLKRKVIEKAKRL